MIEKVNPAHPDKVADRIAGAIVDLAYQKEAEPKIAVEVLIGHGVCHIIIESSCAFTEAEIAPVVARIAGEMRLDLCCDQAGYSQPKGDMIIYCLSETVVSEQNPLVLCSYLCPDT